MPLLSTLDNSIPEEVAQFLADATRRKKSDRIVDTRTFIERLDKAIKIGGQRASEPTKHDPKMKRRHEKAKAAKQDSPVAKKKKKPLWFKLVLGVGIVAIAAVLALLVMPPGPDTYYFDIVSSPPGATVTINGQPTEEVTPTQIVASFGDVITLDTDDQDPVDLALAEDMQGLSIGETSYILEVGLGPSISISTSQEAAEYLKANLPQLWAADASIPGFDGAGPLQISLETPLTFNVTSNRAAQVSLLYLSADDYAIVIYPAPNGFSPALEDGVMANIGEELRLVAKEPLGNEWVVFVLAEDLPPMPEISDAVPVNDAMTAYQIAGAGSPGEAVVLWLAETASQVEASSTFLDVEIVAAEAEE